LAFVGRYSTPDESGYVTVMRPDGTDRHRLSDYVAASGIAFASAGDRLAYAVDDPGGPRIVVQTLSGRPTGGFNEAKMPAWEPHERAMAFVRDRGRAGAERLVFYDGRRFHLIATGDIRFPSWAPDRRWIGWTGGGALSVADSLKGRSHLLAISSGGIDVLAWSSDSSELFAVEWPSS
jgi:hypothetical protein